MVNWSCLAANDRSLEVTMTVTADDLDSVISCVMSGLLPITDRDWSVRAGTLEWDCWHTAEHIGDCLMSFAWQLAVQPSGRYVRAVATAETGASWHPWCARPARTSGLTIRPGWLTRKASPGWAATRLCCTATTSPRPSASASTGRATCVAAC